MNRTIYLGVMGTILLFLSTGCEQVAETTDTINRIERDGLNVNAGLALDGFPEWSMKVVDGVTYLREMSFGTVTQCIVLDTSGQTLYVPDWETIPFQDDQRTVGATVEQITECGV